MGPSGTCAAPVPTRVGLARIAPVVAQATRGTLPIPSAGWQFYVHAMSTTKKAYRLPFLLVCTCVLSIVFGQILPASGLGLPPVNPVVLENMQPGTTAWQLGALQADDVNNQIKGYASATSVGLGQSIDFFVSVNPAQAYTMNFYRIGWYQGLGGRWLFNTGAIAGTPQKSCVPDATTGLIDCGWSPTYSLSIPAAWTSGVYLVVLTNSLGYQNYIVFVLRDGRAAALRYVQPVNTYQAYNNYPDDHATGKSLYEYNSNGVNTVANTPRAVKVSFNRPYADRGYGDFLNYEVDFVRWLERSAYDVTYTTDVDTDLGGARALNTTLGVISAGHSEYWSAGMRNAMEAARDSGVNIGFFGANASYWQVRYEPDSAGNADRVVVCYKDASIDPVQGPLTTVLWRSAPVNRPEQTMVGVQFTSQVNWGNNVDYVVINSAHWAYGGTGFLDGDHVAGLLGYEMDRSMSDYPLPAGTGYTLLSNSPFTNASGQADYSNASIYQAPSHAIVFAAGTSSWEWALDNATGFTPNVRIERTTANILDAFTNGTSLAGPLAIANPVIPGVFIPPPVQLPVALD